ncbi:MAG TPA: hypothetical protein VKE96_17865 [Vicinamibacterales bacterium]|nr:hypothetical protein [Vicinamibacterales bacterium]
MSRSNMFRGLVSAAIAATMSLSGVAVTQQESRFTVNHVIHFTVPSDEQRAALSTRALLSASPPLASIIAEPFFIALEDLNDDGSEEIIVAAASSLNCGSGGCVVVVLEHRAGRTVALLDQNLYTPLAVTNEKIDGYRALASVDGAGAIAVSGKPGTPTSGLQLVYPMSLSRPQRTTQPAQAPVPPAVPAPGAAICSRWAASVRSPAVLHREPQFRGDRDRLSGDSAEHADEDGDGAACHPQQAGSAAHSRLCQ